MKYKNLFFDLDNTLWDFDTNSQVALQELFVSYRLDQYYPNFQSFFAVFQQRNLELWDLYGQGKIDKNSLRYERIHYPFRDTDFVARNQHIELSDEYLSLVKTKTHLKPFAKEILQYAKQKGYRLFIVSNGFTEVQYHKLENSGIQHFFECVFLSEAVKEHKPSKVFFDYAITSSNARKAESLVIGDNWEADIFGAKNAGIDQAYYNDGRKTNLPFEPTYHIYCLSELKTFL